MSNDLISVISYLDKQEVEALKRQLNAKNIKYIVNGHGAASEYSSYYYEIKVSAEDRVRAKEVVNKFKVALFAQRNKCPNCGSNAYEKIDKGKLNFFQRIFFWNTTPVRCKKCKTKYGI